MTVTTIHPDNFATHTERQTYTLAREATMLANIALPHIGDDARTFTTADWESLADLANTHHPLRLTRAAVTALLDAEREDFSATPNGSAAERRTYNRARKAVQVARILWEVGVDDAHPLTPWQWHTSRAIADVSPLSAETKATTTAIIDVWSTQA